MINFLTGSFFSIGFLTVLLTLELITRRKKLPKELTRRIAHFLSGLFGVFMGSILEQPVFITFVIFFLIIISLSYGKKFFTSIHNVKRKTYGELLLPLGILIAYQVADQSNIIFLTSVFILTISDPLSGAVIGTTNRNYRRGSIVFFVSTLIILLFAYGSERIMLLLFIALLVTYTERISSLGTDNLTIPLVSSLLLKFIL